MTIHDLVLHHPGNKKVIAYLQNRRPAETAASYECDFNPYLESGSHPEVVERVWGFLGKELPAESRILLCGTPVLADPATGLLLAAGMGTSYCLQIPAVCLAEAEECGCIPTHEWGDGSVTDLEAEFGNGWVFGAWEELEEMWLRGTLSISTQIDLSGIKPDRS